MKNLININCSICGNIFTIEKYKYNHKIKYENVIGWYCSNLCRQSDKAKKMRYHNQENVMQKKYGYKNVFQRQDVIKKIQSKRNEFDITRKKKETFIGKYGVDNPSKVKSIKNQAIKTNIERYGVSVAANEKTRQEKIRNDNILKYGVKNFIESDEFKSKSKKTLSARYGDDKYLKFGSISFKKLMMEKYGVENCMHIPKFADKCQISGLNSAYQYKSYRMPSGKIIKLQGYENKTLDKLFSLGYIEDEIKFKKVDMPEIWYFFDGKKRRYYPDFFISHKNLIVETKSKYTYEIEKEKNLKKFDAVKQLGYNILTDIY